MTDHLGSQIAWTPPPLTFTAAGSGDRLHLAEKGKETPSLWFIEALEPRALRAVNGRPKAISQAAALVGESPKQVPHAFFNLTEEDGRIIVVYTPGGGQKFYQEFGPVARSGADRATLAGVFAKHEMTLLGPPMTAD